MKQIYFYITLFIASSTNAQNLINNGDAESDISTNWNTVITGEENVNCYGNNNWRIEGNQQGFPSAQNGNYYFYSGCENGTFTSGDLKGEIYQDINVSSNQTLIDGGTASYTFSGYLQTWSNGSGDDSGRMTVEYRNQSGVVLDTYDTGIQTSINSWTMFLDTRKAPIGTKMIRIILRSYVAQGISVDAYFDNLSFVYNSTLSTNVFELDKTLKLFPNPTNDYIQISGLLKTEKYIISSILGSEIKKGTISNNEKLDIQNLNNGLYFMRFENGNTIKFLKE